MPELAPPATATRPSTPLTGARRREGLVARGLDLSYHDAQVVADASLELQGGHIVSLVGPNGSGKSTLLRAMARLHAPDRGELRFPDGTDALDLGPGAFARLVTLLAQSRPTPAGIRVRDLVGYGRHPHRRRWVGRDPEGPAAVDHAMALTGVAAMSDRSVDELSGGELQRVWLATCLAQDTDVLLLDEPTNHLDLRHQVETLDLVRDLADDHGVAIGVVLHDLDQAAVVADRIALLHRGRVHASGPPDTVLTGPNLSEVYGITVEVTTDPATGQLRTQAVGRHRRPRLAS